jgi:hypothetical protein
MDISLMNEMSLGRESCRVTFTLAHLSQWVVSGQGWSYAIRFHRRADSRERDDGPSGASTRDVSGVFARGTKETRVKWTWILRRPRAVKKG